MFTRLLIYEVNTICSLSVLLWCLLVFIAVFDLKSTVIFLNACVIVLRDCLTEA